MNRQRTPAYRTRQQQLQARAPQPNVQGAPGQQPNQIADKMLPKNVVKPGGPGLFRPSPPKNSPTPYTPGQGPDGQLPGQAPQSKTTWNSEMPYPPQHPGPRPSPYTPGQGPNGQQPGQPRPPQDQFALPGNVQTGSMPTEAGYYWNGASGSYEQDPRLAALGITDAGRGWGTYTGDPYGGTAAGQLDASQFEGAQQNRQSYKDALRQQGLFDNFQKYRRQNDVRGAGNFGDAITGFGQQRVDRGRGGNNDNPYVTGYGNYDDTGPGERGQAYGMNQFDPNATWTGSYDPINPPPGGKPPGPAPITDGPYPPQHPGPRPSPYTPGQGPDGQLPGQPVRPPPMGPTPITDVRIPPGQNGPQQQPADPNAGNPNYDPATGQIIGPGDARFQYYDQSGQLQTGAPGGMSPYGGMDYGQQYQPQPPQQPPGNGGVVGDWGPGGGMAPTQPGPSPENPGWSGGYQLPPQPQPQQSGAYDTHWNEYQQRLDNGYSGNKYLQNHPTFANNMEQGKKPTPQRPSGQPQDTSHSTPAGNGAWFQDYRVGPNGQQQAASQQAAPQQAAPQQAPQQAPPQQAQQAQQAAPDDIAAQIQAARQSVQGLGLPNSPEFMGIQRNLEDQLAAALMQTGVAKEEIPAMVGQMKSRSLYQHGLQEDDIDAGMAGRGIYNSGIRNTYQERANTDATNQWQDFMTNDVQGRYNDINSQENSARLAYQQGIQDAAYQYSTTLGPEDSAIDSSNGSSGKGDYPNSPTGRSRNTKKKKGKTRG